MQVLTAAWAKNNLPPRPKNAHKGRFGTLSILAGSSKYRGAAVLAAAGALRMGAGIVRVASIEKVCAAVAANLPSCVFYSMEETSEGTICAKDIPAFLAEKHSAIVAGCGLCVCKHTAEALASLLQNAACPIVLDADALNLITCIEEKTQKKFKSEEFIKLLQNKKEEVVLSPHIGEGARLLSTSTEWALQNQAQAAVQIAQKYNSTVVLKSHVTIIASPKEALYCNKTAGNAGLAKGGSGDVLAGMIGALLAQAVAPAKAAALAVWLHAAAADEAAKELGEMGFLPNDLPKYISAVLAKSPALAQAKKQEKP